ncbi:hypothetical protein N507_2585 [Lacticaseibacillus rhamnosus DSM 14870]|nr:hypothetical protein LRHK_876 [Lacticaseibacillus rhamnosus ATCC 8530]ASY49723.1 hypothetical protein N507_2585 [Lacticaseibacillus rhamnosus DSM 14870]
MAKDRPSRPRPLTLRLLSGLAHAYFLTAPARAHQKSDSRGSFCL